MSGINPQGCQVFSFKHRAPRSCSMIFSAHHAFPARTRADRHLQPLLLREVLIVRVHPEILSRRKPARRSHRPGLHLESSGIARSPGWRHLASQRNAHPQVLLHLSKENKRKRFLARIDEPHRTGIQASRRRRKRKILEAVHEAYEACLAATAPARAW